MRPIVLLILFSCSFPAFSQKVKEPSNGREVIHLMHDAYKNTWYKNLTFTQQTTYYKNGAVDREEVWYEAMKMPDKLLIKIGGMNSADGIIFKSDSQFVVKENKVVNKARRVHDLLVLGFSVYSEAPDVTITKLIEQGYDLDQFKVDIKEDGSKEYVIGDPEKAQFWITADALLFSRLKRKDKTGNLSEIQFNKYEKLSGGWIAPEVLFFRNGQLSLKEVYTNIQTPSNLPDDLWVQKQFDLIKW
jgi:hypothetical protein